MLTFHYPLLDIHPCRCTRQVYNDSELIGLLILIDLITAARLAPNDYIPMASIILSGASDWKAKVTYAIPRIFITLPTFVKSNPDLIALTDGQVKVTSPPPSGGCPLLVI